MSPLDPFRTAENWIDCPRCENSLGWNIEDGLDGQECSCGYVFTDSDDPELAVLVAAGIVALTPRSRPSGLAELTRPVGLRW